MTPHVLSNTNVLADACQNQKLVDAWTARTRFVAERKIWLTVLYTQVELGVPTPKAQPALRAYRRTTHDLDLVKIRAIEVRTRHDLKARIEYWNSIAGHELIHRGMTSCDITDNVDQWSVRWSLRELLGAVDDYHGQPIQAMMDRYPVRGIVGATGTGQDMLDLLDGSLDGYNLIQRRVQSLMGFKTRMASVGQVYPRSLDLEVADTVCRVTAEQCRSWSSLRQDVASGVRGPLCIMRGYRGMLAETAGDQWNEGDVSGSVVRRVALSGLFFAADLALTNARNGRLI